MKTIKIIVALFLISVFSFFFGAFINNAGYINLIFPSSAKLTSITDGGSLEVIIDDNPELIYVSKIDSELGYVMYYPKEMNYIKDNLKEIFKFDKLTLSIELIKNDIIDNLTESSLKSKTINKNTFKYSSVNSSNEFINENYYIEANNDVFKISLNYPMEYINNNLLKVMRGLETIKFK